MLAAIAAGASHPAVAGLLGLGAAGLAGAVVAMAWNVHARQIRLADVRRQGQDVPGLPGDRVRNRGRPIEAVLTAHDPHHPEAPGKPGRHLPPRLPVVKARVDNQDDRAMALVEGADIGAVGRS